MRIYENIMNIDVNSGRFEQLNVECGGGGAIERNQIQIMATSEKQETGHYEPVSQLTHK